MDLIIKKNKQKVGENIVDSKYVQYYKVWKSVIYIISHILLLDKIPT